MVDEDKVFLNSDSKNPSIPAGLENANSKDILDYLFANNNRLLTSSADEMALPKDSQALIAYFSSGELIISRTHKYDGRVLAFLDLLNQKNKKVKAPFYSDLGLISNIYKTNDERVGTHIHSNQDYDNQMQKDFVDIIARAAAQKVSDIHIEVADQTTIYFRIDGSMQPVLEYNSQWGESFTRAAFASADISNSSYAQNEYQTALKDGRTPLRGTKDLFLPAGVLGIRMQFNPISFGSQYVVMRLLYDNPSEGLKTEQEFN